MNRIIPLDAPDVQGDGSAVLRIPGGVRVRELIADVTAGTLGGISNLKRLSVLTNGNPSINGVSGPELDAMNQYFKLAAFNDDQLRVNLLQQGMQDPGLREYGALNVFDSATDSRRITNAQVEYLISGSTSLKLKWSALVSEITGEPVGLVKKIRRQTKLALAQNEEGSLILKGLGGPENAFVSRIWMYTDTGAITNAKLEVQDLAQVPWNADNTVLTRLATDPDSGRSLSQGFFGYVLDFGLMNAGWMGNPSRRNPLYKATNLPWWNVGPYADRTVTLKVTADADCTLSCLVELQGRPSLTAPTQQRTYATSVR